MTDTTRALARYAASTRLADMPDAVRRAGTRSFHNWLGCALGGANELPVMTALAAIRELQMPAQATVLGHGLKLDLQNAALLNAMASNLTAFDDTHLATVIHPTCTIAAPALALAEQRAVSGTDFLAAVIVGIEVSCRIGMMLTAPPARSNIGIYMTSFAGGIGAAAASGRLLGLDEEKMVHALGLAASMASGFREPHPTMTLGFVPGHAARSGLFAALLAAKGFTCAEAALEGAKGLAHVFADPPNLAAATAGLGRDFEILSNAFKPYPCGIVIHPMIDACLEIAATPGFDATAIERAEFAVNPLTLTLCDRPSPRDAMQAAVSLHHWAAAALLLRRASLAEGTDAMVADTEIAALRARITPIPDETIARDAARATVTLRDGKVFTAEVTQCRGSLARPMSDDDLQQKFVGQAVRSVSASSAETLAALCWAITDSADIGGAIRAAL